MFGGLVEFPVVGRIEVDPAADDVLALWRAPRKAQIVGAYAILDNAVAGNTANYFSLNLLNGGAAGTATTAISGTIGGTAGWTALLPVSFSMLAAGQELAAGDVVVLKYDEEGTGTFTGMAIQLDIRYGDI